MNRSVINPGQPDTYRWLALMYDRLAHLVFGGAILRSQEILLSANASHLFRAQCVIWIGGGSGRVLNQLLTFAPQAQVIYIEPSKRMLIRAMRDVSVEHEHRVRWIHQDHTWLWTPQADFETQSVDVLITAFFLDVLTEYECRSLVRHMSPKVTCWLFADFVPQRYYLAKMFIKFMYLCFFVTTGIKQRDLLDLVAILREEGWSPSVSDPPLKFARGLIRIDRFIYGRDSDT